MTYICNMTEQKKRIRTPEEKLKNKKQISEHRKNPEIRAAYNAYNLNLQKKKYAESPDLREERRLYNLHYRRMQSLALKSELNLI